MGKCFTKFEQCEYCSFTSKKNPKISVFAITLARKKIEQLIQYCSLFSKMAAQNENSIPQNWSIGNNSKNLKKLTERCHSGSRNLSAIQRRNSTVLEEMALLRVEFTNAKNWISGLIRAESPLFKKFQVMNSIESEMKQ